VSPWCPLLPLHSDIAFTANEKTTQELTNLVPELHLELFKHFSPTTSACLGLTCKAFHGIHWSLHGKVPLEGCDPQFSVSNKLDVRRTLCGLLIRWMEPLQLHWSHGAAKFVTNEQLVARRAGANKSHDRPGRCEDHIALIVIELEDFRRNMEGLAMGIEVTRARGLKLRESICRLVELTQMFRDLDI
jgi:hypothetical protein